MEPVEVARGIWQLKPPLMRGGLRFTNTYLLSEALVDAGEDSRGARSSLERQLASLGLEVSDLKHLIITHLHRDHIGLVNFIRSASGVKVCGHEEASKISRAPDEVEEARGQVLDPLGGGVLFGIFGVLEGCLRGLRPMIRVDRKLRDGDLIPLEGSTLEVLWTPGHSGEHICLLEVERRILFTGDHILPSITPHIGLRKLDGSDPLRDYLESLKRIGELEVRLVLSGHGEPFTDLKGRIEEIMRHHERRLREVKTALVGERTPHSGVAEKNTWRGAPWSLMPPWVKRMAAEEALAHLVYLKNTGVLGLGFAMGFHTFILNNDIHIFYLHDFPILNVLMLFPRRLLPT